MTGPRPAADSQAPPDAAGIRIGFQVWSQHVGWKELMDAGRAIDVAGFTSLWSNDHFFPLVGGVDGVVEDLDGPIFDGWSVLAGWAAATTSVRLGCLVSGVAYRHPALLVRMATALDHASAGRAALGIGAGWFEREHRAFGFAFPPVRERLDRLEEAAGICRTLLDGRASTVEGRWYATAGARNVPPPIQDRLPLVIGGSGERRTLRIVARYADVWSADGGDAATIAHKRAVLAAHCRDVARDPLTVRVTAGEPPPIIRRSRGDAVDALRRMLTAHGMPAGAAARTAGASPFAGTVDDVVAALRALREVGVEEVMFDWPAPFDAATLEALAGPVRARLTRG